MRNFHVNFFVRCDSSLRAVMCAGLRGVSVRASRERREGSVQLGAQIHPPGNMKRKAGSLQKTKQTKVLKASTKAPASKVKAPPPTEEYSSSDNEIEDIDAYMNGESDEEISTRAVVDFDDGEVSLNLPQKKKRYICFHVSSHCHICIGSQSCYKIYIFLIF